MPDVLKVRITGSPCVDYSTVFSGGLWSKIGRWINKRGGCCCLHVKIEFCRFAVMVIARANHPCSDKVEAHRRNNISLQDYYTRPGTYTGYHLTLRGRRHLGFYSGPQASCFPSRSALHDMEREV
jgi:hypothetical protein